MHIDTYNKLHPSSLNVTSIQKLCSYIQVYKALFTSTRVYYMWPTTHLHSYGTGLTVTTFELRPMCVWASRTRRWSTAYRRTTCTVCAGLASAWEGTGPWVNSSTSHWVSTVYMHNKSELVYCTLVYHKRHLTSNLTKKEDNPLAFSLIHGIQKLLMSAMNSYTYNTCMSMHWWNSSWC